jgi:hypothetical protein
VVEKGGDILFFRGATVLALKLNFMKEDGIRKQRRRR